MPTYRKKPQQIEAVQLTWDTWSEVCDLVGGDGIQGLQPHEACELYPDVSIEAGKLYAVVTVDSIPVLAVQGDWIARDASQLYVCPAGMFEAVYELDSPQERPSQLHRRRSDFESESAFITYALERTMTQLDDLNAATAQLQIDVDGLKATNATLVSDVTTAAANQATQITTLQNELTALQAGNPAIDLTSAIAAVKAIDTEVGTITAAAQAATPAPAPPAPAPTA